MKQEPPKFKAGSPETLKVLRKETKTISVKPDSQYVANGNSVPSPPLEF